MNVEDIATIFADQISQGYHHLSFKVVTQDKKNHYMTHSSHDLEGLLLFLDNFLFNGYESELEIPEFISPSIK